MSKTWATLDKTSGAIRSGGRAARSSIKSFDRKVKSAEKRGRVRIFRIPRGIGLAALFLLAAILQSLSEYGD